MTQQTVTLTISRDDLACLHLVVAAEALILLGQTMRGTMKPTDAERRDRLVALSDKLGTAHRSSR